MKSNLKHQLKWCGRVQWALAAVLVLSLAAFNLLGIRPADARLAAIRNRVASELNQLRADQARAATLPVVEQQTLDLRRRLDQFDKELPRHRDLAQLIGDMTRISQKSSLQKLSWRPDPTPRRTDQFTELPIHFSFQGDFLGVFNFLRQVEDMQRLTRLRKLQVQSTDGVAGQVDVQLTMNVYFLED